jgi:hypothetical protein
MKKLVVSRIIVFTLSVLVPHIIQAQGTTTFLSNLSQTSTGGVAVGNDSTLAALFYTGNNPNGYLLNSIQLGMADASGSPSGFVAMLYTEVAVRGGGFPGSSLGTLTGSADPATSGNYTYTAPSDLSLSASTAYFIVLTAGTTIANGAYEWSLSVVNSYNPSGGWAVTGGASSGVLLSSDGTSWNSLSRTYPQFALNATPVPEPGVFGFLALGGVLIGFLRWKARSV